jgi:WD40 repeat protein
VSDTFFLGDDEKEGSPPPPTERYERIRELGSGGMGSVWRVRDHQLQREVAMKLLHVELASHADLRARFVEEAQATAQLEHPGIVPVYDIGELPSGERFYTMKEVTGLTLAQAQAQDWPVIRLVEVLERVAATVGFAHARGVVHRDLKPDNILIGDHGEVLVVDWGLVKVVGKGDEAVRTDRSVAGHHTQFGRVAGTRGFMAPEQARGEVHRIGPATDVFALGVMLRQFDISGLAGLVDRSTATEIEDRPEDASLFAESLRTWLDGERLDARNRAVIAAAEKACVQFPEPLVREAVLRLLDADGKRRDRTLAELGTVSSDVAQAAAGLVAADVLRLTGEQVRLADGLLQVWPRLQGWLERDPEGVARRVRLELAGDDDLQDPAGFERWHRQSGAVLSADESARILGGVARLEGARRRRRVGLGALALGLAAVAVTMTWLWLRSEQAREAADARAVAALGGQAEAGGRPMDALALLGAAATLTDGPLRVEIETERQRIAAQRDRVLVLPGHKAEVWSVAWTPTGVVSGSSDGVALLWDLSDGTHQALSHGAEVQTVLRSSGRELTASPNSAEVRIWQDGVQVGALDAGDRGQVRAAAAPGWWATLTPDRVRLFDADLALVAEAPGGYRMAFDRDSIWVSAGGEIRQLGLPDLSLITRFEHGEGVMALEAAAGVVVVAGIDGHVVAHGPDGEVTIDPDGAPETVWRAALSADGSRLALGAHGGEVDLFDTATGEHLHALPGHRDTVWSLAFDPTGRWLASGAQDSSVRLWEVESGWISQVLEGHSGSVYSLSWSEDGRLASGAGDGSTRVWDLAMVRDLTPVGCAGQTGIRSLRGPPGGPVVLDGLEGGVCLLSSAAGPRQVADGQLALTVGSESFGVLDDEGMRVIGFDGEEQRIYPGLAFPAAYSREFAWTEPCRLLWEDREVQCSADPWGLELVADPPRVVAAVGGGGLEVFDARSGEPIFVVEGPRMVGQGQNPFNVSSSGVLAVGLRDGVLKLLDLVDGAERVSLDHGSPNVSRVAFDPSGRRVAAGGSDGRVVAWTVDGARLLVVPEGPGPANILAWGPDSRRLAIQYGDGELQVWDVDRGALLQRWVALFGRLDALVFHGEELVTRRMRDGLAHRWALRADPALPEELTNLRVCRHSRDVVAVVPFPGTASPWAPDEACQ